MKRVLFIAPHSFPVSSSESICNSKVAYALAKRGYAVDVYTCVDPYSYPSASSLDKVLKDTDNLRIFSVKKRDIMRKGDSLVSLIRAIWHHLAILIRSGYFYNGITLPDDIIKAVEKNTKKYEVFPYDVMITRGFLTDYAGIYFAKNKGIKWIANWNDPYPEEKFPYPYGKGNKAKLHFFKNKVFKDIQKYASIHTFPNSRLRDYMLTCFTGVKKENTVVIPHMALSGLIPIGEKHTGDVLHIVSCGNVKKPRSLDNFLMALSVVLRKKDNLNLKLKCDFIGSFDSDAQDKIDDNNLTEFVRLLPPQSYEDCITTISNSSISLIIEAICEEGIYLPTKFVDALQCKTPVLCISPSPGVMQDLTNTFKVGYCADNASVSSIVEVINKVVVDFRNKIMPCISKESAPVFFEDSIINIYNDIL